ncbi:14679_t:CDS:2 [Entrophospora sp. SA101]|nr:14679_t:CDS:2 [Entrophospora sp. SA101]
MENALLKPKSKRSTSSHLSQNLMPPNTVNTKAPITTATTSISITPSITSKDNNNNPGIINSINLSLPIHTDNIYVRKRDGRLRRCDRCNDVKPDRCHHCSECDKCILRMDQSFIFGILLTGFTAVHTNLLINNKTTIENLSFKSRIYHLKISLNIGDSVADGINSSTSNFSNNSTNERIFVSSRRGENIWDLGYSRNWKSVMGDKWWQWFCKAIH